MALEPQYLIDNSAMNRMKYPTVAARLSPLLHAHLVASCGALEVEALYSAQSPADYAALKVQRAAILRYLPTEEADWQQAMYVQSELAKKSQHRGPKVPDLLIAAVAYRYDLTLLHYDSDFDRVADLTGQKIDWVVPRGTVN